MTTIKNWKYVWFYHPTNIRKANLVKRGVQTARPPRTLPRPLSCKVIIIVIERVRYKMRIVFRTTARNPTCITRLKVMGMIYVTGESKGSCQTHASRRFSRVESSVRRYGSRRIAKSPSRRPELYVCRWRAVVHEPESRRTSVREKGNVGRH